MDKFQLLQRFFDSFAALTNKRDFFLGFTDYLEYIDSVPEFQAIGAEMMAKVSEYKAKINQLGKIAIIELDKYKEEFEVYYKKHVGENAIIKEALSEYQQLKDGKIVSNMSMVHSLHGRLHDALHALYELPEHKEYASKYIEFWPHNAQLIKHFLPLKEVDDFYAVEQEFDDARKNELWGQVTTLGEIFQVVRNGRAKHNELVDKSFDEDVRTKNTARFQLTFGHAPLYVAWKSIQDDKFNSPAVDALFFDVSTTRAIVTRLHNHILSRVSLLNTSHDNQHETTQKLEEKTRVDNHKNISLPTNFKPMLSVKDKKGYLHLSKNGKKFRIAGIGTRQFCLIKVLFSPENSDDAPYNPTLQNYNRVFEAIRQSKDNQNGKLKSPASMKSEMVSIICYTIKELQKKKQIREYFRFDWYNDNSQIRMTINPLEGMS